MTRLLKGGTFLASVGLLAGLATAAVERKSDDTARVSDTQFAREAAMGGMMEVQLGKIAVQKASNDRVREFGQRMVDDHSRVGDELSGIAAKDDIMLPNQLDAKDKAVVDRFSRMSAGPNFDRAYITNMIRDHRADINAFEKEQDYGRNHELTGWVTSTLPTLRDHLRLAEAAQRVVGTSNISSLRK